VLLAFSQIQCVRRAAVCNVPSGKASCSGAWVSQPKSSGAGTRYSVPLVAVKLGASDGVVGRVLMAAPARRRAACGRCGSAAGRSGRWGRRCGWRRAGNAQAFAFGAARAVVGLFGAQVALDFIVGQRAKAHLHGRQIHLLEPRGLTPRPPPSGKSRSGRASGATAAVARSCVPGLPSG
jgi:hypothetical protein